VSPSALRRLVGSGIAVLVVVGCSRAPIGEILPVPVGSDRLLAKPVEDGWLERLRQETVCLVRGGPTSECQDQPETARACSSERLEQAAARLQPLFDSLPRVMLSQSFAMNRELERLFPGGTPTNAVWDARRDARCWDWGGQPACAAIRFGELAVLFQADSFPAPPDRIEVFLIKSPCSADVPS